MAPLTCSGCGKVGLTLDSGEPFWIGDISEWVDHMYVIEEMTDLWHVAGSMLCTNCSHWCRAAGEMLGVPIDQCMNSLQCRTHASRFPDCTCGSDMCCVRHRMHDTRDPKHARHLREIRAEHTREYNPSAAVDPQGKRNKARRKLDRPLPKEERMAKIIALRGPRSAPTSLTGSISS